jgi:hypothetical protein
MIIMFFLKTWELDLVAKTYQKSNDLRHARKYDINILLDEYLREREKERTNEGVKEYKYESLPFQISYSEKYDAILALKLALEGTEVELINHLPALRDGNLGRELREFIQDGKADNLKINGKPLAKGGVKIRTVTDFVKAVDAIVNPKPGFAWDATYSAVLEATNKQELSDKIEVLKKNPRYKLDEQITDKRTGRKYTAACILAYHAKTDSDHHKVMWLSQLKADPAEIVKGYAMAGSSAAIEIYLHKYRKNPNLLLKLQAACIEGYIFANKHDLVDRLYQEDPALADIIAINYALAGNKRRALQYYAFYEPNAKNVSEQKAFFGVIFGYFAESGLHYKEIVDLNQIKEYSDEIPSIVRGYAQGGKTRLLMGFLNTLVKEGINKEILHDLCNQAFHDSAAKGHHNQIEQLYKKYANKGSNAAIIQGYLAGEHQPAAKGFIIQEVLKDYLENRKLDHEPGKKSKPKEYKHSWLPKFFQSSYTEKKQAIKALESALEGKQVDLKPYLKALSRGTLGENLSNFIKKGRADYLEVGGKPLILSDAKKIRNVSDFVMALHKQVNPEIKAGGPTTP